MALLIHISSILQRAFTDPLQAATDLDSQSLEPTQGLDSRRQLLVRPRHREGRRTHLSSKDSEQKRVFSDWDGQPSWEWDNPRTMYFEPVAGLGNRLRALGKP